MRGKEILGDPKMDSGEERCGWGLGRGGEEEKKGKGRVRKGKEERVRKEREETEMGSRRGMRG